MQPGPLFARPGSQLRTRRAAVDPGLRQLAELLLVARRGLAAFARRPAPRDQIVLGEMLLQQRERAPAVACRLLELLADLLERVALPCHLDRRELPARMTRNALVGGGADEGEVLLGVAGRAIQSRDAEAHIAARHRRQMLLPGIALQRLIARRMAVHVARM